LPLLLGLCDTAHIYTQDVKTCEPGETPCPREDPARRCRSSE